MDISNFELDYFESKTVKELVNMGSDRSDIGK